MQVALPIAKDLVFIGGGHTHAIVLRKFGMKPLPGVRLTLITNLVDTPYSGMLPCHVSGLYDFDESHIDLRPLSRFAHCQLMMDRAVAIDVENQQVICAHHPPVAFDVLSIDTGSTPATVAVPGAKDYAIPAKPVPDLLQAWDEFLTGICQSKPKAVSFAVVGGGVGGVELTLNMQARLWDLMDQLGQSHQDLSVHLFHRGEDIANGRNRSTRRLLHRRFVERGVNLHLQESVCAVEPTDTHQRIVRCESGLTVRCDRVFWVTNASAPGWIQGSGLATDDSGFLLVEDTLQSSSHPNIFAAGDVATMRNHMRPKAGVFAVRQGKPLFHNLQAYLTGQPLQPFTPQKQYLNIIDTGNGSAIASRGPFTFESSLMRAWKDRIDRKFMRLFSDFPTMSPKPSEQTTEKSTPIPQMYCAGCGSKAGSDVLSRTLQRLQQDTVATDLADETVLIGLTAPDDAAIVQLPPDKLAVHTVDYFTALVDDPFVFAQIVVKHCLNDLYAMGATPHTVLAIATLPYGTSVKQSETLFHLLSGVQKSLMSAKASLVGGHTTTGEQLALGLSCNGLVTPDAILRKQGMQIGDALILTQPLGTGTLFAADMQKRAKGRWIENAIAYMIQSSQAAMKCLKHYHVTACTDVTGFGLLGHLVEMTTASEVAAELDLQSLPVLEGAYTTLDYGIVSSLQPQNRQAARSLKDAVSYANRPDYPILFDPQTAGGLLATVPSDRADDCVARLHELGYAAVRIGTVVAAKNAEPPITIKAW
ncbi:selenide, water dikinase SelD [Oscillatoria sp. CS-180]|uniref:selenide, water dikinase SelD n=1 Tax=Oscillatoria sp. CS-180 TaxID=3021720 RepID=UPI00232EF333|nr:selenide, water dikinase SelD [Oscillatoria sp. CS-180]MDB9529025.1 selenide, water dikinase SelD [Oscillatoria sp. CS-180]